MPWRAGLVVVASALPAVWAGSGPSAVAQVSPGGDPLAQSPELELVGFDDLGGGGLNGEVDVLGDIAIVASGIMPGGGLRTHFYNPYPCPATETKLVDLSDPSDPNVVGTIPVAAGVAARDVDAIEVETPTFTGALAAVALARCNFSGNLIDRGVEYYDINDPTTPVLLGRYDADLELFDEQFAQCEGSGGAACASSQDSVSLQQRPDGRVISISTEPFSSASNFQSGDLRIVDVTDPTNPVQIGDYDATLRPGDPRLGYSRNGCRPFTGIYGAELYDQGQKAVAAAFDDGLLDLAIDPPPGAPTFSTDPAATLLGQVDPYPAASRSAEGNGAYATFAGTPENPLGLLSDEDWIAPDSKLYIATIDGSPSGSSPQLTTGVYNGCQAMFTLFDPEDSAQIYRHEDAQVPPGRGNTTEFAYVGSGCPGVPFANDPATGEPVVVEGRIAVAERAGCPFATRVANLQANGAIAVLNSGQFFFNAFSPDGDPSPAGVDLTIPLMTTDEANFFALRETLEAGIAVEGALVDRSGFWGGLRVADLDTHRQLGGYTTPRSRVFPPPDLGVYSVHHAVAEGERAHVAWNSDGLRILDLSKPARPAEVGHFVPPDTPDPTGEIPDKAYVVGVDVAGCNVVISDINSGLYVVEDPALCSAP